MSTKRKGYSFALVKVLPNRKITLRRIKRSIRKLTKNRRFYIGKTYITEKKTVELDKKRRTTWNCKGVQDRARYHRHTGFGHVIVVGSIWRDDMPEQHNQYGDPLQQYTLGLEAELISWMKNKGKQITNKTTAPGGFAKKDHPAYVIYVAIKNTTTPSQPGCTMENPEPGFIATESANNSNNHVHVTSTEQVLTEGRLVAQLRTEVNRVGNSPILKHHTSDSMAVNPIDIDRTNKTHYVQKVTNKIFKPFSKPCCGETELPIIYFDTVTGSKYVSLEQFLPITTCLEQVHWRETSSDESHDNNDSPNDSKQENHLVQDRLRLITKQQTVKHEIPALPYVYIDGITDNEHEPCELARTSYIVTTCSSSIREGNSQEDNDGFTLLPYCYIDGVTDYES